MEIVFAPRGILQINDAKICFRNFRGEETMYNAKGNRNFAVIIPNEDIATELQKDLNKFGVGWNVKIKAPREEGETPFMYLPVKLKYTDRSKPRVYLESGRNKIELNEDTIDMLDDIEIVKCDLDIRPYDDEGRFGPFRTAYVQAMWVEQNVDRFAARFAEEEYPDDDFPPFE